MAVGQLLDEFLDGIDTDGCLSPKAPPRLSLQRGRVRAAVARRGLRAGESQAIPPSVVHSVDVPDSAVLSVEFLTRRWRHQEARPGGASWR